MGKYAKQVLMVLYYLNKNQKGKNVLNQLIILL